MADDQGDRAEALQSDEEVERKSWQRMELRREGRLSDIMAGGGGKLSVVGGDPGESRKQPGQG